MTTLDFLTSEAVVAKRPSLFAGLKGMWLRFQHRRRVARTLMELSALDARMLRDIGIEPLDLHDAMHGRRLSVLFYPMRRPDQK